MYWSDGDYRNYNALGFTLTAAGDAQATANAARKAAAASASAM